MSHPGDPGVASLFKFAVIGHHGECDGCGINAHSVFHCHMYVLLTSLTGVIRYKISGLDNPMGGVFHYGFIGI
jgi:hypothetical protein